MFVLDWLASKVRGTMPVFHGDEGMKSRDDFVSTIVAAAGVEQFAGYSSHAKVVGPGHAREFMAYKKGLRFEDEEISNMTLAAVYEDICDDSSAGDAYYISVITHSGTTQDSHALGMCNDARRQIHFFDPNVGEYRLTDRRQFFADHSVAVTEAFGFAYGGATAKRVNAV